MRMFGGSRRMKMRHRKGGYQGRATPYTRSTGSPKIPPPIDVGREADAIGGSDMGALALLAGTVARVRGRR